jgi:hypothetical protein
MALQSQNKRGNIHKKEQMIISDAKVPIETFNHQMKKIAKQM